MFEKNHIIIRGSGKNDILIDVTFLKKSNLKEVVIFSHGFKGFKDWGPFNHAASALTISPEYLIPTSAIIGILFF